MKRAILIALSLFLSVGVADAKDVLVAPTEYRMYNVFAARGHEKQCVAITDGKDLLARFTALGVTKPDVVIGMIDPAIDWQQSAAVLLYQPDPPPDVVPKVRSLLKDANKEKLTLLFRYADPKEPPPPEPAQPRPTAVASTFSLRAVTVGTDDVRDRASFRSPLLLIVLPKLAFLTSKSLIECTQKM